MSETHPEKRPIGYARVSTYSQLEQLRAAGCGNRNIYREKVTGARADRRELLRMLGKLAPGDVVTVTRIDRLARSTFDLFGIVKRIVDAKAQFRSLAEPWADTGTSTGRLMLAVLGGLADVERDLIRTRTAEGRSRAKAQGKAMGRPPSLTPAQQKEATSRRARGATLQELADSATTAAFPPCAAQHATPRDVDFRVHAVQAALTDVDVAVVALLCLVS
jgi:DNA invertase Pin-like site-specific DNA recombinase